MPRLSKIGAAALAAFGWTSGSSVTASYLVVAGGGGGGGAHGGGGGAGGLLTGSLSLNPSLSYTVTVGAGGVGTSSNVAGNNGSNSTFSTATAIGGGGGGAYNGIAGVSGGSGGGGGGGNGTPAGGSGTVGQGNAGGSGNVASYREGGGGGGAGATGGNASTTVAGNGGAGSASSITGSSVTYAGGGGGGSNNAAAGSGGSGGGGAGGSGSSDANGNPGTANLGGGGGGAGGNASGGNGGSGIVIISYTAPQQFSGGVVTTSGGNVIHTFTTSGTLGPITTLNASYLIVAGGGSGGNGNANIRVYGGGGAGGMLTGSGLTIDPNSTYLVTVGAGGASQTTANSYGFAGSNSTFSMVATAAVGGGSAGTYQSGVGGSGGGGGNDGSIFAGAAGTSGQGNAGGNGDSVTGGGGGGAGAVGGTGTGGTGGTGGAGLASSISGTSTYYAGGGGGGGSSSNGAGGIGGGSTGNVAATANTGGGGGGTATNIGSGAGGSGIVIISYPGATQQMAGGTVTIVGGNVIHTFTSTGYLAPIKYVGNSLRFRSSASAYLSRTPAGAGSQTTWTWSGWVKRGLLSSSNIYTLFSGGDSSSLTTNWIGFYNDSLAFSVADGTYFLVSTPVYRDPSAWYHIVAVYDSTNATSSNRIKLYVNGVQITSFSTSSYPTQNYAGYINGANGNYLGVRASYGDKYFDGYLTEVNFIDGQALTPSSFGTFNSYGVWQPITYGGSYGTNGFYLPFTNTTSTTTLGYDFSPNGNNWTTNNISLTAGVTYDSMTDVPTLTSATAANFAVVNPLKSNATVRNGNLEVVNAGTSGYYTTYATASMDSGKYYWEISVVDDAINARYSGFGVADPSIALNSIGSSVSNTPGGNARGWMQTIRSAITVYGTGLYNNNASVNTTTRATTSGTRTFMVAYDANTGKCWMGYEGTWWTGDPAAGTTEYFTATAPMMPILVAYNDSSVGTFVNNINFGQRPFAYTPPSGFVALNTYNL